MVGWLTAAAATFATCSVLHQAIAQGLNKLKFINIFVLMQPLNIITDNKTFNIITASVLIVHNELVEEQIAYGTTVRNIAAN